MSDLPVVTDDTFDATVLRAEQPVVIDLWAEWCAPCRAYAPAFESAAADLAGRVTFAKLNTDDHPALRERLEVLGIPTTILFANGTEVARFSGGRPRQALVAWVQQHTANGAGGAVTAARPSRTPGLLAAGPADRVAAFTERVGRLGDPEWDAVMSAFFAQQDGAGAGAAAAMAVVPLALGEVQAVVAALSERLTADEVEAATPLLATTVIGLVVAAGDPAAAEVASLPLRGLLPAGAVPGGGRYGDATAAIDSLLAAARTADAVTWSTLLATAAAADFQLEAALDGVDTEGDQGYRRAVVGAALAALRALGDISDDALARLYGPIESVIPLASLAES